MTNVDKRQKDLDRPWQLSVKRRGAGLRLGLFPENGIIYKLNLRRVFTAMGRFDVTVIVKKTSNICSSSNLLPLACFKRWDLATLLPTSKKDQNKTITSS